MALIQKQKFPDGTPLPFPPKTMSVCMIVKNEEATLDNCLKSALTFADEIIVVDTGSTDRTVQIARSNGAKVINSEWKGDFSYSRNISLDHATCSWILWLDADDVVTEGAALYFNRLKKEIEQPVAAFGIKVKNIQPGGLGEEFLQVRLFPNDRRLRFEKKVHEQIAPSINKHGYQIIYLSEVEIHHTGYQDNDIKRKKALRNREILAADMVNFPNDPNYMSAYADTFAMRDEWEEAVRIYKSVMDIPDCKTKQADIYEYMPVTIALSYKHMGNFNESLKWVDKGLQISPDKIELTFLGGEVAFESGDMEKAEHFYRKTVDAPEKLLTTSTDFTALKTKARVRIGNILLARGDTAAARSYYESVKNDKVSFYDVPASIAETYLAEGNLKEAVKHYSESILKFPGLDVRAYRGMAAISLQSGRADDAVGFCEKGLSFYAEDLELLNFLKELYRERGDMKRYLDISARANIVLQKKAPK
ncbi:MAG: glycosyltransferase [Fibrobacteres bacterium]|nr:glycosyltransferase [Fibrobacterota bacterium]